MSRKKSKISTRDKRDPVLDLYFNKKNRRAAIVLMKRERFYAQARTLLPKLGALTMYPDLRLAIAGTVAPSTWDEVITPTLLPPSIDWLQEFGWLAHGFLAGADRLNSFLQCRKKFGRAYLLGDYASAKAHLNNIADKHGVSLWLAEREFMLLQASTGFEGHKQKLSEIQAGLKNSVAGYFVTILSNRLEPHVTHEAFQRTTGQELDDARADGHDVFASWAELHIAPWRFGWLNHKHEMLHHCEGKTLVDRYDRAIKILSCIPFDTLDQNARRQLSSVLGDLASVIIDRQLTHLTEKLERGSNPTDVGTDRYFDSFDALVAGEYARCAMLAEELILEEPTCFEFFWLLARAIASSAQHIVVNIPEHSVARSIFNQLLQIAQNRVAINLPLVELNSLALKLGDNHLGLSMRQFAQYEESGVYDATAANQIAVQSKIDASLLVGSHDPAAPFGALGTPIDKYKNHISVKLEIYGNGSSPVKPPLSQVAPLFASLAISKRLALEGRHIEVLAELEPLIVGYAANSSEAQIHGVTVARLQFEALIGLDQAENAARAITQHYLQNPNNLRHVQFERLIDGCKSGRWPTLRRLPCWPILVTLNNGSEQDVYEAVDDLLLEHGCSTPLSIADGTIVCSVEELRIILRDILIPIVISRGALWNRTAEERRQMRKQILQRLFAISLEDQALVVDELSQLEQAQLLEVAYRDIEGPKFELNYSVVNRELAKLYEGTFARYSEFRSYEAKGGMLANEGELLTSAREGTEIRSSSERRTETSGLLLRQIVFAAFIQYILDTNAGINAFLGTRIRHGSLENQVTRVLGSHTLLALKNAGGVYVCDVSLLESLKSIATPDQDAVVKAYVDFTHTINSLVANLVTSILRIRVPEKFLTIVEREGLKTSELRSDIGLLDFSRLFSEDAVARLDQIEFSSISSLLTEAETMFVSEANAAFVSVREYFERTLAEDIRVALQSLENAIQVALPEGAERAALRAQILAAKGECPEDLKIISTWFSAAKPTSNGLGSLHDIICMAGRVVNFASNGKLGHLAFGEFQDEKPATDIGRLMYEVISILLRNVVQHSRIENSQEIYCEHLKNDERSTLILSNRVCDEQKCKELIERAEEAIARPFDEWALGTAPGGTGFVRIRKLLKQAGFSHVEFYVQGFSEPCRFETQIHYCK